MIRLYWPPGSPDDIRVAHQSFHEFRARGLLAQDRDGNAVDAFDPKTGYLEFKPRRTWMERLDQIGDDDETTCNASDERTRGHDV